MYSFEYPEHMNVGRVCFEMSLKPLYPGEILSK